MCNLEPGILVITGNPDGWGGGVGIQAFGSDLGKARERRTGLLWLVGIAAEKGEWALYTAFTATVPPPSPIEGMYALTLSIWQAQAAQATRDILSFHPSFLHTSSHNTHWKKGH